MHSGGKPLLDLLEIQRQSFFALLENGIVQELSKIETFHETTKTSAFTRELELVLKPESYRLISPNCTPKQAILKGSTYACKLYVQATLTLRSKELRGSIKKSEQDCNSDSSREKGYRTEKSDSVTKPMNVQDEFSTDLLSMSTPVQSMGRGLTRSTDVEPFAENKVDFSSPKDPSGHSKTLPTDWNIQRFSPWIFLGELPLMTKRGHFILNGSPRVIVNQITRCPGVYFQEKRRGVGFEQEVRVSADFIPQRGPWLRIQSDWEGRFWARLKREGRVKYTTLYEAFQEFEKQYTAPLVNLVNSSYTNLPKSEIVTFQERKAKEERQKKALVRLFKNSTRYNLGKLGRLRINERVHNIPQSINTLQPSHHNVVADSSECFQWHPKQDLSDTLKDDASCTDLLTPSFRESTAHPNEPTLRGIALPPEYIENNLVKRLNNDLTWLSEDVKDTTSIVYEFPAGGSTSETGSISPLLPLRGKRRADCKGGGDSLERVRLQRGLPIGKKRINCDDRRNYTNKSCLMAVDIDAVHTCLERLLGGGGLTDDIDHLKNRLVRTSGELLQQQLELGLHRLSEVMTPLLRNLIQGQSLPSPLSWNVNSVEKEASFNVNEVDKGVPHSMLSGQPEPFGVGNVNFCAIDEVDPTPKGMLSARQIAKGYSKDKPSVPTELTTQHVSTESSGTPRGKDAMSKTPVKVECNSHSKTKPTATSTAKQLTEILANSSAETLLPSAKEKSSKTDSKDQSLSLASPAELMLSAPLQSVPRRVGKHTLKGSGESAQQLDKMSSSTESTGGQVDIPKINSPTHITDGMSTNVQSMSTSMEKVADTMSLPEESSGHSKTIRTIGNNDNFTTTKQSSGGPMDTPFRWLRTSKPVNGAFREFFGSNPLSQYMDQTNPLAEITHKRRLSSMGPGGIKRETAGMEVRGIHPTHYGRVCPIETPEGKNAGLVNSPTVYGRIGVGGFMETPLYKVAQSQVQKARWTFFSAQQEEDEENSLATGDTGLSPFNLLPHLPIPVQTANNPLANFQQVQRNRVGYKALSPVQTISIATALIPFLEHDDANRALMGSNMQRQAIPLLLPERPIVGTGFESMVMVESGQGVQAIQMGCVSHVSSKKIVLHCLQHVQSQTPSFSHQPGGAHLNEQSRPFADLQSMLSMPSISTGVPSASIISRADCKLIGLQSFLSDQGGIGVRSKQFLTGGYAQQIPSIAQTSIAKTKKSTLLRRGPHGQGITSVSQVKPVSPTESVKADNGLLAAQLMSTMSCTKLGVRRATPKGELTRAEKSIELSTFAPDVLFMPTPLTAQLVSTSLLSTLSLLPSRVAHAPTKDAMSSATLLTKSSAGLTKKNQPTLPRRVRGIAKIDTGLIFINRIDVSCFVNGYEADGIDVNRSAISSSGSVLCSAELNISKESEADPTPNCVQGMLSAALTGQIAKGYGKEVDSTPDCSSAALALLCSLGEHQGLNRSKGLGYRKDNSADCRSSGGPSGALQDIPTKKTINLKVVSSSLRVETKFLTGRFQECTSLNNKTSLQLSPTSNTLFLKPIEHTLQIYQRSNQETCLSQRPLVKEGDWVQKGDLLADCAASDSGDLALGKNVIVAYMPWEGYNFEDAIVISDRLVADDVYTSVHIERYEIKVNKNSQGKERITNQIPSLPSRHLRHLDQYGIAQVSSWMQPGDILVGKVVELKRPLSPYERLAWELASRLSPHSPERDKWLSKVWLEDISLRLPTGVCGRVVNSQIVSSQWSEKDQTTYPLEVHVYLAVKRKIQIGDKLAGRHGNKGIVSIVLPRQDMPYLADGSSVDMVLNPLGVPSRMNLGQIFECLLGLAGSHLGCNFKVTPFDEIAGGEASRSLVFLKLYQCRLIYKQEWLFTPTFPGKSKLFDGRTGEPFENWVTVGRAYMLKLIHMVDHKIHARSTGPYSLFTRQPVRGRARRGGQRLGEMEVWAVEGFGAAYTLQEFLTIKSDDLQARTALQRGFYKNNDVTLGKVQISPGNPEAFKVLVSELQALCLHIQM